MKYHIIIALLFISFFSSAQEKGVTPINNQQPATSNQQTYAVVVGISDYQDERIPDLRFADKDAEAFANFLRSPAGGSLDRDHLKLLTNNQATGASVSIALDRLIEVAKEGDRVIIYFSGHGDVESKRISQPGYLLGWDAPAHVYMAGGAVNIRDLQDIVSTLSVQNKARVVVITDACRSGKLSGSDINGAQLTGQNLARQYANEIKILSCQPDEYSIEGEQWGGGRGAFSYHLLDGLYGMADRNSDASVNLMEIRGYLEEHVSTEVAPQNQLPMIVGNGREKLTDVFPEILAQIKDGRKGQMQMFTATESRGIEGDVLAAADSNTVVLYLAFQKAINEKQFLQPIDACADFYYEKLCREPQLERLHSSMRRNYAAALQNDAQQVMNTILKSGLTKLTLRDERLQVTYKDYPAHLQRASELLGKGHYMYNTLQARKLYFEGMSQEDAKVARIWLHKALALEPDMPHAVTGLISTFIYGDIDGEELDSAEYYFQKAIEMIPSWVEPYNKLSEVYELANHLDKAEEILRMAGRIDSSSVKVWYHTANVLKDQRKYEEAVKFYKKVIEATAQDICFPCASNNLGWTYAQLNQYEETEKYYKKAIQLDSSFTLGYYNLGEVFQEAGRWEESEVLILKAIELDSTVAVAFALLGNTYTHLPGRIDEAEKTLNKALEMNPDLWYTYICLAKWSFKKEQLTKAWQYLEQGIQKSLSVRLSNFEACSMDYLENRLHFEDMRKSPKWNQLMQKYFPEQFKTTKE